MAHYDEQLPAGHLPVPMTHFPPGYPLFIAGVSRFGLAGESAGYLVSIAGFLITIWLTWDVARTLGASPMLAFVFALPWVAHREALIYASAVLGESVFSALLVGMVALIVRDLKTDCRHPALLVAVGALAGAAYSVRYAGLSLIPAALLYLLWRFRQTREARPWALTGILPAGVFMIPIQIRNIVYSGSWRGLDAAKAPRDLFGVILIYIAALYHLILGDLQLIPIEIWLGLFALSMAGAFLLAFRAWRRGAWGCKREFPALALAWIGLIGVSYTAGIIVATRGMANIDLIAADLARYYVPLYPVLLPGAAGAVSLIPFRALRFAAALLALSATALHSLSFTARPGQQEHVVMAGYLGEEVAPGQSLRHWVIDHVPEREPIVAQEGQAMYYVLRHATVTPMEPPDFSNLPYDGPAFFSLMSRYKSRYLFLFPVIRPPRRSLPFLSGLITGGPPDWLKLRVRTSDVEIYECEACAR